MKKTAKKQVAIPLRPIPNETLHVFELATKGAKILKDLLKKDEKKKK